MNVIGRKCKVINKDHINYNQIGTIKKVNSYNIYMVIFDDGFSFLDECDIEVM